MGLLGRTSSFERAIEKGLKTRDLSEALHELEDDSIRTARDARAVVRAIDQVMTWDAVAQLKALHTLSLTMQDIHGRATFDVLSVEAVPRLFKAFESLRSAGTQSDKLLMVLKIGALYRNESVLALIVSAARDGFEQDSFWWSVVFGSLGHAPTLALDVCSELAAPLPNRFIGVALLDMANELWRTAGDEVGEARHPFDSPEGCARLETYLRDPDSDHYSYAHSATAALPFVSQPMRTHLLAIALDHADVGVQMEAAWASASTQGESGIKILKRYCVDWRTADPAKEYLTELGREDAIPDQAHDEDFCAMATMSAWLQHPNEYGQIPDDLEILDTREIFWPPVNERRRLWMLPYTYRGRNEDGSDAIGFGLVGGKTTWSFMDAIIPDWPVDDMYALHCSWETQLPPSDDRKYTSKSDGPGYSLEHGRKLLAAHNRPSR